MMGQLVDPSLQEEYKTNLAVFMCSLKSCCIEKLFSQPVIQAAWDESGNTDTASAAQALIHGSVGSDLQLALRSKTSNIEIELNFARASSSRSTAHGKACHISSMVSKHITSELKLAQRRSLDCETVPPKHSQDYQSSKTSTLAIS